MGQSDYKTGDVIGNKYVVYNVLGKGGCGIVYHVYSKETGSVCALKTFLDKYMADAQTRERFRKEAAIWISLDEHPFIVRAHFLDDISGRLFIGMEYVEPSDNGWNTLEDYLKYKQVEFTQGLRWAIQFCFGMEHAYRKGITAHRDIKPSNIMIAPDKSIKITDFGLAGFIARGSLKPNSDSPVGLEISHNTMLNSGFGTPTHMPPEQFVSAVSCDERSDIYSFGVVLYQISSNGNLPFNTNNADQYWQLLRYMHTEKEVPRLESKLYPIIQRCMAKQPSNRYQHFHELRAHLEVLFKKETNESTKIPSAVDLSIYELINKGTSLNNIGLYEEAIVLHKKAVSLNPKMAMAWTNLGLALSNAGKHSDAIQALDTALTIDPAYASAWLNKGLCYDRLEKFNEACISFKKAVEIDDRLYMADYNLGNCLFRLSKYQEALSYYDKALLIFPHYAPAWSNKGKALIRLGLFKAANDCLDRALAINPMSSYAWYNKGFCSRSMGKIAESLDYFDKALAIKKDSTTWHTKGQSFFELGRYDDAMHCFQSALDLEANNIEALRSKVMCFWAMGQPHDAIMFAKMSLLIVPNDAMLLFVKASIEDNIGMAADALKNYTSFIKNASAAMEQQINMAKSRIEKLSGSK